MSFFIMVGCRALRSQQYHGLVCSLLRRNFRHWKANKS